MGAEMRCPDCKGPVHQAGPPYNGWVAMHCNACNKTAGHKVKAEAKPETSAKPPPAKKKSGRPLKDA